MDERPWRVTGTQQDRDRGGYQVAYPDHRPNACREAQDQAYDEGSGVVTKNCVTIHDVFH